MATRLRLALVPTILGITLFCGPGRATPPATPLKVGDRAPDFTLPDQNGKPVKLSDLHGKRNVVLAFYVLAFTGG